MLQECWDGASQGCMYKTQTMHGGLAYLRGLGVEVAYRTPHWELCTAACIIRRDLMQVILTHNEPHEGN